MLLPKGKEVSIKMIVDTTAYVLSLISVLACSLIRDFLIPLVVWRKHLRNKSYGYRFWFCILTQAALLINLVLLLGFFNICNRYLIIGISSAFYLLVVWNYSDKKFFQNCKKGITQLGYAYREDRLSKYIANLTMKQLQSFYKGVRYLPVWNYIRRNLLEVLLLCALVGYNIWFLTRNAMLYHCYQFSDIPVHQSWIYYLEHGELFVEGIYPFGMHAMIYIIRVIFGLNLREILIYAGSYQTILLMIGMYLLAKEIFYAKYTPITVVLIISLMMNQSRYAAALPQEYGVYAIIGLAYFMIRYLHQDRKKIVIEGDSRLKRLFRVNAYINRRYLNSETVLLMLCVSLVIAYHFYTAIAAIFFVIAIGLAYLPKILKKQYFIPLMYCGIMGAIIAVLPFVFCLAKGIPFQGSMAWATSVITGDTGDDDVFDYQAELEGRLSGENDETSTTGSATIKEEKTKEKVGEIKERRKLDFSLKKAKERIEYYYNTIYTYGAMFGVDAKRLMFQCMLIGLICGAFMRIPKRSRNYGCDYMALIINMLLLCTIGAAPQLGITELIAAGRASTFEEPFIGFMFMMPVDFVFRLLGGWRNRYYRTFLNFLSVACCVGIAFMIVLLGWYHAFFPVFQPYYNETEYVLRHIKKSYEKNSYTIVSTTDEYYEVLDYGYHTQLSEFINMVNGKQEAFKFPTEYVFFFIEKRVLFDHYYGPVEVGLEYAAKEFVYFADTKDYSFQRAIIESQAYYWAQKFMEIYPNNFKVYYEDDVYVVYILEQNVYSTYDLRVNYLADYADEITANGWKLRE